MINSIQTWLQAAFKRSRAYSKDLLTFLHTIPLLKQISNRGLRRLSNMVSTQQLAEGTYLFREGEPSSEFYIIIDGTVEIIKYDTTHHEAHFITELTSGQILGEMALLDNQPRSTSVRACTATTLISIPFAAFKDLIKQHPEFASIYQHIASDMSQRLRHTNEMTVQALEENIEEYELRVSMGKFMLNIFGILCCFTLSLSGLSYLSNQPATENLVIIPVMLIMVLAFALLVKYSGLPYTSFGLNLRNWRQAVYESVLYTLPFMALIVVLKWALLTFTHHPDHALFEPFSDVKANVWLPMLLFYCFFVSPAQELIARGGLQGSLEIFLVGKNKIVMAIFMSNLIFATAHTYISIKMAVLTFLPGIFWGWLYSRQRTLVGVTLSHIMLGVWASWVVGIGV